MSRFSGERAVVVGLGVSGAAAAEVLAAEGAQVRVSEQRPLDRIPVPPVLTDQVRETIQQTLYSLLLQRRSVFF